MSIVPRTLTAGHGASRRKVVAWAFYDFANSAFTTLVVTFVYATYFTTSIAPDEIMTNRL